MRPLSSEPCASAMRACEQRLRAAEARNYHALDRFRAETELIRKAWQIVLCARSEVRRTPAKSAAAAASPERQARSQGTSL